MTVTAFAGSIRIAHGALPEVALAVRAHLQSAPLTPVLLFEDASGRVIDLDLRGTDDEIRARLPGPPPREAAAPRQPGRPKLGVVSREVTLLPRHWSWLSAQPGGASAALRRLVEDARKADSGRSGQRAAQERTYRVLAALAGDRPGYEESLRALFAGDMAAFAARIADWPTDIAAYAQRLAQPIESD